MIKINYHHMIVSSILPTQTYNYVRFEILIAV